MNMRAGDLRASAYHIAGYFSQDIFHDIMKISQLDMFMDEKFTTTLFVNLNFLLYIFFTNLFMHASEKAKLDFHEKAGYVVHTVKSQVQML